MSIEDIISRSLLNKHADYFKATKSNGWFTSIESQLEQDSIGEYNRTKVLVGDTILDCMIADTPELQSQGLQGHRELGMNEAMVFPFYEGPRHARFHMGSVNFPIDLIFVGSDSRVAKVVNNAEPGTRDQWAMPHTSMVIEVNGGFCRANGIEVGLDVGEIENKTAQKKQIQVTPEDRERMLPETNVMLDTFEEEKGITPKVIPNKDVHKKIVDDVKGIGYRPPPSGPINTKAGPAYVENMGQWVYVLFDRASFYILLSSAAKDPKYKLPTITKDISSPNALFSTLSSDNTEQPTPIEIELAQYLAQYVDAPLSNNMRQQVGKDLERILRFASIQKTSAMAGFKPSFYDKETGQSMIPVAGYHKIEELGQAWEDNPDRFIDGFTGPDGKFYTRAQSKALHDINTSEELHERQQPGISNPNYGKGLVQPPKKTGQTYKDLPEDMQVVQDQMEEAGKPVDIKYEEDRPPNVETTDDGIRPISYAVATVDGYNVLLVDVTNGVLSTNTPDTELEVHIPSIGSYVIDGWSNILMMDNDAMNDVDIPAYASGYKASGAFERAPTEDEVQLIRNLISNSNEADFEQPSGQVVIPPFFKRMDREAQEKYPVDPRKDYNPQMVVPNVTRDRFKDRDLPDVILDSQPMDGNNYDSQQGYDPASLHDNPEDIPPVRPL